MVGRSNIVGKPMAMLLQQANATVTLCHSKTVDLAHHTRQADVLVAAVGRGEMITKEFVKPGAVVIDVGMNRNEAGKLVGDVNFEEVAPVCSAITPVPGGVGPDDSGNADEKHRHGGEKAVATCKLNEKKEASSVGGEPLSFYNGKDK